MIHQTPTANYPGMWTDLDADLRAACCASGGDPEARGAAGAWAVLLLAPIVVIFLLGGLASPGPRLDAAVAAQADAFEAAVFERTGWIFDSEQ